MDKGIRLILAPRSARAKQLSNFKKSHGMRNRPGSSSFSGSFFKTTAEQFSFKGGWMFFVLGCSVSFVASGSFSTTSDGIRGPSYEIPLQVVMALALFLGFGMVLLGRELELEALLL
uniref:Uncharacterized protein n=1 Tax=Tanacetum cinerariifolium TaxID=118510 RepID=A0A699JGM1_TANCI|nr:hypothetical protein [Tanacetum cinerariifolium]